MSGDVQPRKRKDKKRRKDEAEQILTQPIHTPAPTNPNPVSDDVNIHVHKEGGTGGGICAKLVFFVLLSALVVVIGMIITQYRGLSDVDTIDTESKFAQIFEGWIDTGHRHDDHHHVEEPEHEDDEENISEDEASEEENESEAKEQSEENDEGEDEEDEDENEDEDEDEEPALDQSEEDPAEESEENSLGEASDEKETYGDDESEEKEPDEDEDDDEPDHDEDEQELENIASEEANEGDLDDEGDSTEDKPEENDADESDEKISAINEKIVEKREVEEEPVSGEEKQQESSGMAVKLGVGVALLVVAHLVLVRKWRSAPVEKPPDELVKEQTPVMSRRNTIVAPPPLQEVEPDIEQDEEDYSDEEISTDEETQPEPKSAKTRYQELRSTYTRSLTPEGEIDYHKEPEGDDEEYDDEEDEEISEEEDEEEEEEEEDEGESENEDYDEDEDEELLKRLEAKYGKLHGEKRGASAKDDSDAEEYEHSNVTNKEDHKIKEQIDEAQKSVQNNSAYAIKLYDKILQKYPLSPRSIYGKALSLDHLADQKRSNEILEEALQHYLKLFNTPDVPNTLFQMAAERCINRMRFVGQYRNAINVHWRLIKKFPDDPKHLNNLAVTYLTINRVEEARAVLKELLSKWPEDGLALVHYGFILKTTDDSLEAAVAYLQKGLATKAEGVTDGRFYFHLGDALARLGRTLEAMRVYEEGVKNKVFLSKYQRSLYNMPGLTGKPWWEVEELPYLDLYRALTQNWRKIRDEGLAVLNEKGYFQDESENLKDVGDWKQFELFARGQKNVNNCKKCPFTCAVIEKIPEARGCKRGQTKFSVMHPGTHVWPHCGPTNCRLRLHLGLKVPPKTFIRVADEIRSWNEGKIFVFDDSFEHEVWHNGTDFRLVLIVDVWHPELTSTDKRSLSPI